MVAFLFFIFYVILVVENWCLWLSFSGRWLCGFTGERERQKGREERMNCLFLYIKRIQKISYCLFHYQKYP